MVRELRHGASAHGSMPGSGGSMRLDHHDIRCAPIHAINSAEKPDRAADDEIRAWRRRRWLRAGPAIRPLACPNCGHEPTTRPEALRQREDLAVVWLHQHVPDGPIIRYQHCASCQPHNIAAAVFECARCGDGPLLTGALAVHINQGGSDWLPAELRTWLTNTGWRLDPQPLCPHEWPPP